MAQQGLSSQCRNVLDGGSTWSRDYLPFLIHVERGKRAKNLLMRRSTPLPSRDRLIRLDGETVRHL